jgi:hypothetical protein
MPEESTREMWCSANEGAMERTKEGNVREVGLAADMRKGSE